MKHSIIKTQKGIGLIEVLIATVVVAVGLLAVASLQGKLMSSSGDSKTRSEARVLAERKIEDLRNNVTVETVNSVSGYNDIAVGTSTDSIAGTNASFTRSWTISGAAAPNRKKISVRVGWDGNGDGDVTDADEIVNIVTEMAWINPANSLLYATENSGSGTSAVPSPRQNASEDVAAEKVLGGAALSISGTSGVDASLAVTIPSTTEYPGGCGTVTLHLVDADSHFYTLIHAGSSCVEDGVIAVFLCTATCIHIQNHFGGVVHRIAGTVHSTSPNGFDTIKVAWTSSSVSDCYNGPVTEISNKGSNQYRYRPYECIYAGNCDADVNGSGCNYGVTAAQISARKVGPGGEYGDVGLLGVDDQGKREQVCFLEDTVNPATSPLLQTGGNEVLNDTYLYPVTKRFYAARRIKRNASINDQKTEGINHSYTNHNFLVVPRGSGGTANKVCHNTAVPGTVVPAATAAGIQLPPREILRTLNEVELNTSLSVTNYTGAAGTAKTFTGTVTGSATKLKLIIPEVGNCYLNNNTNSAVAATLYACAAPENATGIAINGGSSEHPTSNPAVFKPCTKTTDITACNWTTDFP
ncbi:MAG: hypothetical protein WC685_12710 [Methylobacter sp.]|jgi:type IV pilus modification protein PilV